MKMAFGPAGDVREVDLLAAFVALWREARSGSLLFSRGAASAGFELAEGEVVAVSSSEPRFETAAILVRAGKLESAALDRLAAPPGSDAALAALAAGILTRREWKWGEKIRAIEILADVLSWPDGRYVFDPATRPGRGEFVLSVPRLLLELFLRSRDRNLIEHQLGPIDEPLVRSAAFDEEFATFGLTADAESVVRLIDGTASATEICERAPAEEFAVLKLLAALRTLGLLRTEEEAAGEPERLISREVESPEPQAPSGELPAWTRAISSMPEEMPASAPEETVPEETVRLPDEMDAPVVGAEESPRLPEGREIAWPESAAQADAFDSSLDEEPRPEAEPEPSWPTAAPDRWDAGPSEPLDRPLADEPAARSEGGDGGSRRPFPWLVIGILVVLLAAVAATILWRSRSVTREAVSSAIGRVATSPTAVPTAPPPPVAVATVAPTPPPARPSPAPSARPRRAPAAPAATSAPARQAVPVPAGEDRAAWLDRARKDAKRLEGEKKTRYAIQLELACETGSLVQAWTHDRPAGTMWLLTAPHGDKQCFRVLWGRYGSIAEARQAKAGIPGFFVTSTNHPAVVAVR
jgi:septal ring-binding cell division protein DamX